MNLLLTSVTMVFGFFLSMFLAAMLMFENAMETWKAKIAAYLVYLVIAFSLQSIGMSIWLSIIISVVTVILITDILLILAIMIALAKLENTHPSI